MKVAGIALIDGLTEATDTSAQRMISQRLERGARPLHVRWGSYLPVSQDGSVETVEVFPYFFGIEPAMNPGRAGFELVSIGQASAEYSSFVTMRSALVESIASDAKQLGIRAHYSPFSNDKRTLLLAASSAEARDQLVERAASGKYGVTRSTHLRDPLPGWNVRKSAAANYALLGWCHGALRAALDHAGMDVSVTAGDPPQLPAPAQHHSLRLQQVGSRVRNILGGGRIPVMYLKDAAYEARRALNKHQAISRIAELIARFCAEVSPTLESPVLLISDHNSEAGRDETLAGETAIGVVGGGVPISPWFDGIPQAEVVAALKLVS